MANLSVTFLGLNRITASMGLALRRYMTKGGKHQFTITGYDPSRDMEKQALKLDAVDQTEHQPHLAIRDADLVVLALSYDEVEAAYRYLAGDLRDGAVVLDTSPVKAQSVAWAAKYLTDEQHLVGISPTLNPIYMYQAIDSLDHAEEDLFDNSAIILSPAADVMKEAVDLAFNFCQVIGSRPRFLDPLEHDTVMAQTSQLPQLLGVSLFYHLLSRDNWEDLKWFTDTQFGVTTRALYDIHPDAMRDSWAGNHAALARTLDSYIETLQQLRQVLEDGDKAAIEAVTTNASETYEAWINSRYRADWDAAARNPEVQPGGTMLQSLLGERIASRLTGQQDEDDD